MVHVASRLRAFGLRVWRVRLHLGAQEPVFSDKAGETGLHLHVTARHSPVLLPLEEIGRAFRGREREGRGFILVCVCTQNRLQYKMVCFIIQTRYTVGSTKSS